MTHSPSFPALRTSKGAVRLFIGGFVVAAAAAAALPALAQGHHGGGPMASMDHGRMGHGGAMGASPRHIERMLDSVNATEAQRGQIKKIVETARADMKTQHEAGRGLHDKSRALLAAPTIDTNALEQVRQQMLTHHEQVSRKALQVQIEVAQVLTPEQRAKLSELMAKRMQHMHRGGMAPKA
jgi:periplasmic protein CpxP/Spy